MSDRFPQVRLRRLRQNRPIRDMLAAPLPGAEKFVWPTFVVTGKGIKEPISSMPGQFRYSIDTLLDAVGKLMQSGIKALMLFGVVDNKEKSDNATYVLRADGIVQRAICTLKQNYPELLIFTDVCVCEYTNHGHCGIIDAHGNVLNDPSLELLAQMAVSHAKAGADVVAPSAMMDGQIQAIRTALDTNHLTNTILMSYSTKFSSSMYNPFREAAASAPNIGDRKAYQANFRDLNSALRESEFDEAEGADILMVKPAMSYLDVITRIKQQTRLPLAAYNVSGEYAMLIATADRGWGDLKMMVGESIAAMDRAGVDIFISYWANQYEELIRS